MKNANGFILEISKDCNVEAETIRTRVLGHIIR